MCKTLLQDCCINQKSIKVTGAKQPKACMVPQISEQNYYIWCSCAIVLVSSYYLISYQYYTKLHLRNTSDKYAVIIWNIKTCIGQNVFVTLNTHTCGDVVWVNYLKNWISVLKASMNNFKTMSWKKSGHMDIYFITMHTHIHTHTPECDQKLCPVYS